MKGIHCAYTAIIDLSHINKLRILRIHVYWGVLLELVDPDVTSACDVLNGIGKSPQSANSPKKVNGENCLYYVIDSPLSLLW